MTSSCRKCAAALPQSARFCPSCGARLSVKTITITIPMLLTVVGISAVASAGVSMLGDSVIGKAPSKRHTFTDDKSHGAEQAADPELDPETKQLAAAVERNPADLAAKKAYADRLWNIVTAGDNPPQRSVLDLVDVLGQILKMQPEDGSALLMMANVAFNQRVFDKSVEYYERYLKQNPSDLDAKASYASSLTFIGRFDDAMKQLDAVLKKEPKHFQALAYKAIVLAQTDKTGDAIALGKRALELAPSRDAKERFGGFLDSLKGDKQNARARAESASPSDPVTELVRNHPVTGPKFESSAKQADGSLRIFMREFPMEKMPPNMRESFLAKIKAAAQADASIRRVDFVDAGSNAVMVSVER